MYVTGTLWAGAIGQEAQGLGSKSQLESQSSTYWLIQPGRLTSVGMKGTPLGKSFNLSKPRFLKTKWRQFLLFLSHKVAVKFK